MVRVLSSNFRDQLCSRRNDHFRGNYNAFGAFQTYYEEQLLLETSASAISWIGSIEGFMILIVGVLTGPIFDAGYFTSLIATGSLLIVLGLMMTSLSTTYSEV